jgi:hypothetical protein
LLFVLPLLLLPLLLSELLLLPIQLLLTFPLSLILLNLISLISAYVLAAGSVAGLPVAIQLPLPLPLHALLLGLVLFSPPLLPDAFCCCWLSCCCSVPAYVVAVGLVRCRSATFLLLS